MLEKLASGSTRRPHSSFVLTNDETGALDELTYAGFNGIVNYSIRTSVFYAGLQDSYVDTQKILPARARSKLARLPLKARKASFIANYRNPRSHRFKRIGQIYPIDSADLRARLNKKHRPGLYKGFLKLSNRNPEELPKIRPRWWGLALVG